MYRKWLAFGAVFGLIALINPVQSDAQPPGKGKGGFPPGGGGFQPGGPGGFSRDRGPGGFQGGPGGQPMVVQGQPGGPYQVQPGGPGGPGGFSRDRGPGGFQGGPGGYQGGPGGPGGYPGGPGGYPGGPGGPSGDRRDRGPGGPGGGSQDPERIFMTLVNVSGGRDTIRFDNIPPETKAVMRQMSERMGTPPLPESGEWTRAQFMDHYQRSLAMRQSQPPMGPGGPGGEDRGYQRLREQDRDGDGRVSRAEADRMLQPNFDRIDVDRDGYVTLEEYRGYYASQSSGNRDNRDNRDSRDPRDQGRPNDQYSGNFYDRGDGRNDGRDQKKEVEVAVRYGKLPKDAPGYFNEYDMNKDGQLELSEWRLNGGDIRDFIKYDLDGDGILTYNEYNRYKEQQATLAKTKVIDPDTGEEYEVDPGPGSSPRSNPIAGNNGGQRPSGPTGGYNGGGQRPDPRASGGKDAGGSNPFRNGGKK